jgi:hypothetical protein
MSAIALAITTLGGMSILVGFAATAYASVRGAKDQANIRSWERAVQARDDEIAGLRLTVARHEATMLAQGETIAAHEVTIAHQSAQISALEAERPSAEQIAYIKKRLDQHDQTVNQFIAKWEQDHA